jgi:anti-anti-sigma factor
MSVVDLKASVTTVLERSVVALEGRLDEATANGLEDLVAAALAVGRPELVLDLSGVPDIDEHGLTAVTHAAHRASRIGVLLVLRSPTRQVLDMLMLTGADGLVLIDR